MYSMQWFKEYLVLITTCIALAFIVVLGIQKVFYSDDLGSCLEKAASTALTNDAFNVLANRCAERYGAKQQEPKLIPFKGELEKK